MSKQRRNVPNPGYFKVAGTAVEDRSLARRAKQALGREAARRKNRAGMKTTLGEAPPEQHAAVMPGGLSVKLGEASAAKGKPPRKVKAALAQQARRVAKPAK